MELDIREPGGRSLRHIITRAVLVFLLGLVAVFVLVLALLGNEARVATKRGGQQPAEPFRIAHRWRQPAGLPSPATKEVACNGAVTIDGRR